MSECNHENAYVDHVYCPDCGSVWVDEYPNSLWFMKRIAKLEAENAMLRANVHLAFYEGLRGGICPDVSWKGDQYRRVHE
jgi:hypothetical protein